MIRQEFTLEKYDWHVRVYYAVTTYYADEIVPLLYDIGCRGEALDDADENLTKSRLNTGLTYSNLYLRETVMVIALTSTAQEFAKSWRHEMGHLADHIAQAYDIDPHGEEIQYIGDEIVGKMWNISRDFLCECCRKKKHLYPL